jgi:SprT protein
MRIRPHLPDYIQDTFEFLREDPLPSQMQETASSHPDDSLDDVDEDPSLPASGPDTRLEEDARQMLLNLGIEDAVSRVKVLWNPRLKSTAGYAAYPSWRIELNPRLVAFDGQVDRTLKHELAHLIAYHRAGRRRIEPHGPEWRRACADLGIPGEAAHHRLPLPRSHRERKVHYQCPHCLVVVKRVRPFKRATACLSCCKTHNNGQYDERFRFQRTALEPSSKS